MVTDDDIKKIWTQNPDIVGGRDWLISLDGWVYSCYDRNYNEYDARFRVYDILSGIVACATENQGMISGKYNSWKNNPYVWDIRELECPHSVFVHDAYDFQTYTSDGIGRYHMACMDEYGDGFDLNIRGGRLDGLLLDDIHVYPKIRKLLVVQEARKTKLPLF